MTRWLTSLGRLFQMARCFAKHGALAPFEDALANAGIAPLLLSPMRLLFGRDIAGQRPGERLAAALTELGPAFIKFGQALSTRSDLLGSEVAADLARLQDRLPAFSAFAARATIESELGAPIEDLFLSFDDEPVSAASISQVHFAIAQPDADFPEGRPVAVKVLRPGIEAAFARDIDLLLWIAEIIERSQPKLRRLRPVAVVKTFAALARTEMDLRLEAAAASELRDNFADDPSYRVPAIDWRRTGKRVMTQERLTGIPMDDGEAMRRAGLDIPEILARAAAIFFNQAFRDGYFHGDQHPGNMSVGPDGAIQAVDFGIMGRLDEKTRTYLADMLLGFLDRDYARIARVHLAAGYLKPGQKLEDFALALRAIGEPIQGRPLNEISFASMLGQLFAIAETFDMEVQPHLLLLQKNMLMAEGISRQLDPSLNLWTLARPLIEDWMIAHRGPRARLVQALRDTIDMAERAPSVLRQIERLLQNLAESGWGRENWRQRLSRRLGLFAPGSQFWLWLAILGLTLFLILR